MDYQVAIRSSLICHNFDWNNNFLDEFDYKEWINEIKNGNFVGLLPPNIFFNESDRMNLSQYELNIN